MITEVGVAYLILSALLMPLLIWLLVQNYRQRHPRPPR